MADPASTTTPENIQQFSFKAETRQLLNFLIHSLYKDREVFLRELLSNASDALNRLRFEMVTNQNIVDPAAVLKIQITADKEARLLTIQDTGIGITRDEIIENLGTIAQSGARKFIEATKDKTLDFSQVIGQFGVGFYSVFMVAEWVRVTSRSFKPEAEAVSWHATGEDRYEVGPAQMSERGTRVEIKGRRRHRGDLRDRERRGPRRRGVRARRGVRSGAMSELASRGAAALGIAVFIAIAWAFSEHRRRFPLRVVAWGLGLQLGLALLLLRSAAGRAFFVGVNDAVNAFIRFTDAGTDFVFGALRQTGFSFALEVLPVNVVMGSMFSVLYHWGVVQLVVRALARGISRTMGISAAESLSTVADVFVGMPEAPLLIRPYLARMTRSELFTVMTAGMATIAGSVLVAYAKMLGGGDYAGHLVTASFMAAPAAVLLAKVMVPETAVPETSHAEAATVRVESVNTIDAAAAGASAALRLAANVGALLIAFIALLAMANAGLEHVGGWLGIAGLTLQLNMALGSRQLLAV